MEKVKKRKEICYPGSSKVSLEASRVFLAAKTFKI
jgi:hypothetical protein